MAVGDKEQIEVILFDDESVREKCTVMSKWDAVFDDARNDMELPFQFGERVEAFLQFGRKYRITIEEI